MKYKLYRSQKCKTQGHLMHIIQTKFFTFMQDFNFGPISKITLSTTVTPTPPLSPPPPARLNRFWL